MVGITHIVKYQPDTYLHTHNTHIQQSGDGWYYIGQDEKIFGPFKSKKMRDWFEGGFLPNTLQVRLFLHKFVSISRSLIHSPSIYSFFTH